MSKPFNKTMCCIKHGTGNRQCKNRLSTKEPKRYEGLKICTRHYNDIFVRDKHLDIYEPSGNTKALMIPDSYLYGEVVSELFNDSDKKTHSELFNDSDKKTGEKSKQCTGITQKGTQCKRKNNGVSEWCFQHDPNHITKNISSSKRESLWINTFGENFVGKCYCCEFKITPFRFEVGHNKAKCHGGNNEIDNLRCICTLCNRSMGTQPLEEWKKK